MLSDHVMTGIDIFNVKYKYGKHTGKNAYGIHVEKQNIILNNMMAFINEIRIRIYYLFKKAS